MLLHWLLLLPLLASSSNIDNWLPCVDESPQLEMLECDEDRRGDRSGEIGGDWSSSGSDEVEEWVDLEAVAMLASELLSECLLLPWLALNWRGSVDIFIF